MANIISIIFTFFFFGINPSEESILTEQQEITTYYFIRHAEKDRSNKEDKDPSLTEEGLARATKWAEVLKDVELDAVYSTDYNRTMQTAFPCAEKNKLSILKYDPSNAYTEDFQNATRGKTVLIVGHSNTTPTFVNKILGKEKYADLDDSENGALFIVQILPGGIKTSQVLYFN
ncbi:SixA phosphatase family protein [Christiangramia aquimixticola]|uniref:SixA phosphatase family protein n=1 Tax=Christiangramia aquimixticola TaxID=1697558 RepID=UPI003AA82323